MNPNDNQNWNSTVFTAVLGAVIGYVYSVVSIKIWIYKSIAIAIIKLAVLLIEWADERWYQLEIADRPGMRGLTTLTVGFAFSVALLWLGYFFNGNCCISVTATAIDLFSFGLGLVADPDKDWEMPAFPTLGKDARPDVHLNI